MSAEALRRLRDATAGSEYENRLFLVGGYVRDKLLNGDSSPDDIDLVLDGDALEVARWLRKKRVARYDPVEYGQFGTTQIQVEGAKVEIVTARAETYRQGSRKPIVTRGTIATDALRRDFTINTFLENLNTGEIVDPLGGAARSDLDAKILRTPLDPGVTFTDDPLRMLRACRFAAKLGFAIADETLAALFENAFRLNADHGISFERIREELNKTLLAPGAVRGLDLMRETGLLKEFAPELAGLPAGIWNETLARLRNLPANADLCVRVAALFASLGAKIARSLCVRLRYSNDETAKIVALVGLSGILETVAPGDADPRPLRRLVRKLGVHRADLFALARADASGVLETLARLDSLAAAMSALDEQIDLVNADSPLTGDEIMALLNLKPGRELGRIKQALIDAVIDGDLSENDRAAAEKFARSLLAG